MIQTRADEVDPDFHLGYRDLVSLTSSRTKHSERRRRWVCARDDLRLGQTEGGLILRGFTRVSLRQTPAVCGGTQRQTYHRTTTNQRRAQGDVIREMSQSQFAVEGLHRR